MRGGGRERRGGADGLRQERWRQSHPGKEQREGSVKRRRAARRAARTLPVPAAVSPSLMQAGRAAEAPAEASAACAALLAHLALSSIRGWCSVLSWMSLQRSSMSSGERMRLGLAAESSM